MQTFSETKVSTPATTKYEEKLCLDRKQEKKPITSSQPTSFIQKLNSLMQKTRDLQGKEAPFTKSISHVDYVPRVTPNIYVKIERVDKSSNPRPHTYLEEFIN